jgi:hypothetical protein
MSNKDRATVRIRDNATGEERDIPGDWTAGHRFLWLEGNFGCDCNRELLFCRAADEDEPDFDDLSCGEGRYSLVLPEDWAALRGHDAPQGPTT